MVERAYLRAEEPAMRVAKVGSLQTIFTMYSNCDRVSINGYRRRINI